MSVSGRVELVWASDRPVEAVFATIARDAIDLLTGPLAGRIRECATPDCALLLVDRSGPGQRQWCAGEALLEASRGNFGLVLLTYRSVSGW
jgi:predicted RNA-binding Zn ribbon-like protein